MAITQPDIEWFYDTRTYWREYGLINLAGKWAVVRQRDYTIRAEQYDLVTEWLDDKKTAIGFLKLLKEE